MHANNVIFSSLILTLLLSGIPCLKIKDTGAYFQTKGVVDNINHTLVAATFYEKNYIGCAFRCSQDQAYVSLYYDDETATCHCNNGTDKTTELSTAVNSIVYAYRARSSLDVTCGSFVGCVELQDAGYRTSGIYEIHSSDNSATNEIYCDNNGEWTVFQKRFNGSVDFYRPWDDYVNGFGSPPDGEFWLGLETIHSLTAAGSCELMVHLEAEYDNPNLIAGYARYSSFYVGSADTNYKLNISGFSGNVGDSMHTCDQRMFTTLDEDNDIHRGNCATIYKGGWWYNNCHLANLNGLYLRGHNKKYMYAKGVNWCTGWGSITPYLRRK